MGCACACENNHRCVCVCVCVMCHHAPLCLACIHHPAVLLLLCCNHGLKRGRSQDPGVLVQQMAAAVASSMLRGGQSEGEVQASQQEEVASLEEQLQQAALHIDRLTGHMKQMNLTVAQVTPPPPPPPPRRLLDTL